MEGVDSLYTAEAPAQETPQQDAGYQMATIGTVEPDGVTLIFDGEGSPSEKHYKVNAGAQLAAGQRVLALTVAGSYVVLCAVGAPSSGGSGIPAGGTDGQMLVKNGSTAYALKWADAPSNPLPTGGTDGQVLTKNGSTNYAVKWATISPKVAALTSGSNTLTLSSKTLTPSTTGFAIGTSSYQVELHSNSVRLYYSSYKYCTLTCTSAGKLAVNGTAIN